MAPAIVIAGVRSGVGKTTIATGKIFLNMREGPAGGAALCDVGLRLGPRQRLRDSDQVAN